MSSITNAHQFYGPTNSLNTTPPTGATLMHKCAPHDTIFTTKSEETHCFTKVKRETTTIHPLKSINIVVRNDCHRSSKKNENRPVLTFGFRFGRFSNPGFRFRFLPKKAAFRLNRFCFKSTLCYLTKNESDISFSSEASGSISIF